MDLICSLYSWWEGFGSSSLVTLPLGFNCGFISTSACGSSTGVCFWVWLGGIGFAPVKARCGGGAAALVPGLLAASDTQGSWWLRKNEIWYSRRVWQQVLAHRLQYSCLENPSPWQRRQSTGSQRVGHYQSNPVHLDTRLFLPVAALPSESWAWSWCSCLACGDKCAGTQTVSATRVMALSEIFLSLL